jgi:hypothetical protein
MKNFNKAIFLQYRNITAEQQVCVGTGTSVSYRLHCHLSKTSKKKIAHQCNRILERTLNHYKVTFSKKTFQVHRHLSSNKTEHQITVPTTVTIKKAK